MGKAAKECENCKNKRAKGMDDRILAMRAVESPEETEKTKIKAKH